MHIAAFQHAGEYRVGLVSQDSTQLRPFVIPSDKRPGDVVRIEVDGIGAIENRFI